MKAKKKRQVVKIIIFFALISIIAWIIKEEITENKIKDKEVSMYDTQSLTSCENQTIEESSEIANNIEEYPKEEIISNYNGYDVIAKLEIPKIDLETYVLKDYSVEALNISVTKFWGADANKIGNFCIAGHNFKNKNMFRNLKKLEIGDKLTISDNEIGRIEYEIYEIYKVEPEDVSCLSQDTNETREVTLITCTNDSKKRIIVKAREI